MNIGRFSTCTYESRAVAEAKITKYQPEFFRLRLALLINLPPFHVFLIKLEDISGPRLDRYIGRSERGIELYQLYPPVS